MLAGTLSVMMREPWPETPSLVAYTEAVPTFRALTCPPLVTERTAVSLEDHWTGALGTA